MLKRFSGAALACLIVATVAFSVGTTVPGGDVPPPPISLLEEVSERSAGTQPSAADRGRRAERTRDQGSDHGLRRAAPIRALRGRRGAGSGRASGSDRAGGTRNAPASEAPSRGGARPATDDDLVDGSDGGTSDDGTSDDGDDEPSRAGIGDDTDEAGQEPVDQVAGDDGNGDDDAPEGDDVDGTDDDDQPDGGAPGDGLDD